MNYIKPNFNNLDGEVQNFEVVTALENMRNDVNEDFGNEFDNEENMSFFEGDDDFYNAKGSKKRRKRNRFSGTMFDKDERARRRTLRENTKNQRQARRDQQSQSRIEARAGKTQTKLSQAETQKTMASQLGVETESDKALANALAKGSEQTPDKPGMSTGAKVGIAVGILALLGVIGFVVVKKMKSNK